VSDLHGDLAFEYARAIMERVPDQVVLRPGSVVADVGAGVSTAVAMVRIDGDSAGIQVQTLGHLLPLSAGERVMVLFYPPSGALVLGRIGAGSEAPVLGAPALYTGSVTVASTGVTGDADNTAITHASGPTNYATVSGGVLAMLEAGRYQVALSGGFGSNNTGTSRVFRLVASVAGTVLNGTPAFGNTSGFGARCSDINVVDLVVGETLTTQFRHDATAAISFQARLMLTPVGSIEPVVASRPVVPDQPTEGAPPQEAEPKGPPPEPPPEEDSDE